MLVKFSSPPSAAVTTRGSRPRHTACIVVSDEDEIGRWGQHVLVALIFAKEAWIQDVLKLSQNSSSAPLGSDGWQSSPTNRCPSLEERAIAAATSRELLPACGPWCSQAPCKPSASSARQVFQYGWGVGRWSGGRWRCEERRWTVERTQNRTSRTLLIAGDQAAPWSSRAGPSVHTHNLWWGSTVSCRRSMTSTAPSA